MTKPMYALLNGQWVLVSGARPHAHATADVTDLGSYPNSHGQATHKIPTTDGADGWTFEDPEVGQGIAPGGTTDQTLTKQSATDFDTSWGQALINAAKSFDLGAVVAETPIVVTHNFGTRDIAVSVVEKTVAGGGEANGQVIEADVSITSENTISLTFGSAAPADTYRVRIIANGSSIIGARDIRVQETEPTNAQPGTVWLDPRNLPGPAANLVGYWDARDLSAGAITTWPARYGGLGDLTGTGTAIGIGQTSAVSQPRLLSANTIASASSITQSTPKAFFFIGKAYILGADNRALHLVNITPPSDTGANRTGMWWYNYSGNVLKILGAGTNTAAGISQLSINTRYLLIVNHTSATSGTAYTYQQTGTSTALSAQTWNAATSKLCVGTTQIQQVNEVLDGEVTACGIYDRALTTLEISNIRTWASSQFGSLN